MLVALKGLLSVRKWTCIDLAFLRVMPALVGRKIITNFPFFSFSFNFIKFLSKFCQIIESPQLSSLKHHSTTQNIAINLNFIATVSD